MRLLVFSLFVWPLQLLGQPLPDKMLILQKPKVELHQINRNPQFGFSKNARWYVRYNPVYISSACMLYLYQKILSPQFSASCGYDPSCSAMSKKLISEFGVFKGVLYTADRLTRCNKFSFAELEPDEIDPKDGKVHEDVERYK
ncbi:MAG: membrane protein insertion efficiency factor YidD [Bacteroidales bacterium]|nr:membrane protein insertion efficiency factor YidD [Bacteroidales bacterium]